MTPDTVRYLEIEQHIQALDNLIFYCQDMDWYNRSGVFSQLVDKAYQSLIKLSDLLL